MRDSATSPLRGEARLVPPCAQRGQVSALAPTEGS